ncbi:MAG: hypothetical protein U5K54_15630 [Cytophagales bacterium]|nr:hypothetical protein [Cytophagales bacterium]
MGLITCHPFEKTGSVAARDRIGASCLRSHLRCCKQRIEKLNDFKEFNETARPGREISKQFIDRNLF